MLPNILATKARRVLTSIVVSSALVASVATYEGFRPIAYRPLPQDVLTLGSGFTRREDGTPIQLGDTITKQESDNRLRKELSTYKHNITKCITVPLTDNEANAYISLSFNIGIQSFCGSTLVKKLNRYDYAGACKEILKWNMFKGKQLKGLTARRQKEYNQCLS